MFPKKLPGEELFTSWYPILFALAIGFLYGLRLYFRGPQSPSRGNLKDKTAIVTGSSSGIGLEIAKDFIERGCRVIFACKDEDKMKAVFEDLKTNHKMDLDKAKIMKLDLSSFQSIHEFADQFLKDEERLDILVNNAGVISHPQAKTEEGFEIHFGVNYLGHFLLTHLLLDKLKAHTPSRVVNNTALAYKIGDINFEDINLENKDYTAGEAYAQSKLALVLFTRQLSRVLEGTGVTVNVAHPGVVNSNGLRHMPFKQSSIVAISMGVPFWFLTKTVNDGAQTAIQVATADEEKDVSGKLYSDCRIVDFADNALDDDVAKKLYDLSLKMTKLA